MNNFTKMKNIDWNSYKKELDVFVNSKITFLQKFLKKNFFINENKEFYYKIFFLPLSRYYFNKKFPNNYYEGEKKEKSFISKLFSFSDYLKIESFKNSEIKFTKNVSINFFYRHSKFRQINSDLISEISGKKIKKKISFKSFLINIRLKHFSNLKKKEVLFLRRRIILLILNYKFLKKNSPKIKNILINTHGVMSNIDQVMLGCLSQNAKIISMVSGLPHFMYKYHDQDDYIEKISSKILTWGKNIKKNSKYITFGSFYSNMNKAKNKKESIIILPSVPNRNSRNPVSSYANLNKNDFSKFIMNNIINEIEKINNYDKNCMLQCKIDDFNYYKIFFQKYKIKNNLVYADINNEEFGRTYNKTYVLYFSTAIVENFFVGSSVKICMNSAWIDLQKKYETELNKINNKNFLKINEKFIKDTCCIISPTEARKKLIKILN